MTSSDDQRFLDYVLWNGYVSDERKLFYVATPKVACTSLKWWFAELEGVAQAVQQLKTSGETDPELVIHDSMFSVAPQLIVQNPERLDQIKADEYFSFALVRNPYKRLFSAWQSKILLREPLQIEPYQGQSFVEYPVKLLSDVTGAFECFLEYLCVHERNAFKDFHWTPQYDLIEPALSPRMVVSKIEDTAALNAALRIHLADAYIDPFTKSKANESLIPYLPEFISPRSKELIDELYAKDFETYAYPTLIPPAKEQFSQEQLTLALKGIDLLRGRHQRMSEMRQCSLDQMAVLLKDKEWLDEQRETWMAFGKSKEDQVIALESYYNAEYQKQKSGLAEAQLEITTLIAERDELKKLQPALEEAQLEITTLIAERDELKKLQPALEETQLEITTLIAERDELKKLQPALEEAQLEIAERTSDLEKFLLKHKKYLAARQFVDSKIVAQLRKVTHIFNRSKGA